MNCGERICIIHGDKIVRQAQILFLPLFLPATLLLAMGHLCRESAPAISKFPVLSRWQNGPTDSAAWVSPHRVFELREAPSDGLKSFGNDPRDATFVRPAWGVLVGIIVLSLYIYATMNAITLTSS